MSYLLDNKKVYIIISIVIFIYIIIYMVPDKKQYHTERLIPITTPAIIGYEPRYFNKNIYTMPNAKGDPNMLYGSQFINIHNNNNYFERLLPDTCNIPKINNIQAWQMIN